MAVDDSHQQSAIAITIAFGALGFVFVALRVWSRFLSSHRLSLGMLSEICQLGYVAEIGY
jgi:hypothetical protein